MPAECGLRRTPRRQSIDLRAHNSFYEIESTARQFEWPEYETIGLQHEFDLRAAHDVPEFFRDGGIDAAAGDMNLLAGQVQKFSLRVPRSAKAPSCSSTSWKCGLVRKDSRPAKNCRATRSTQREHASTRVR